MLFCIIEGKEVAKFEWRMEEHIFIRHLEFEFRHSPVGEPPEGGTPTNGSLAIWSWVVGQGGSGCAQVGDGDLKSEI